MLQRLRAARHNEDGFTLIELLIVIVILGVLAGIVVFAVNGITDRGVTAACKSDIATVQVASEAYYAKNNSYATDMDALKTANLLKDVPNGAGKYTIKYVGGTVTGFIGDATSTTPC